jgi:uncharacterized protein YukE
MSNVHVDYTSLRYFAEMLSIRARNIEMRGSQLQDVTFRLGRAWEDDQFDDFYDDARRMMSLIEEFVRLCDYERQRLEKIADAAEAIHYR